VTDLDIRPVSAETWPALEALFREGGDPRWCWCQSQVGDCPYSFRDAR
jgi:hypothetical protein